MPGGRHYLPLGLGALGLVGAYFTFYKGEEPKTPANMHRAPAVGSPSAAGGAHTDPGTHGAK